MSYNKQMQLEKDEDYDFYEWFYAPTQASKLDTNINKKN